jgi:prepilin-type N-terminal cleavage/methylation domain-containing protein
VREPSGGFTLVEVLLAVVVLVVGVLAVAGSAAMSTRMIGRGLHDTSAALVAGARVEWLRQLARSTSPPCADARFASGSEDSGRVAEAWTVAPAGAARRVAVAVGYPVARGPAHDTLRTLVLCR